MPEEILSNCLLDPMNYWWNPACIVNARINIHPQVLEKLNVFLIPKELAAGNESNLVEKMEVPMGDAEELPSFTARGRFPKTRKCAFVDLTEELHMKRFAENIVLGKSWLVMIGEYVKELSQEQVKNFAPFLTLELSGKKTLDTPLCRNAIAHRELTFHF